MNEDTARSLARRRAESKSAAEIAGIDAALRVGGYDPETVAPDTPEGYIEAALSNGRAWNPAYLSTPELRAMMDAREDALGGFPF